MGKYSKAIAAGIGFAVVLLQEFAGTDLGPDFVDNAMKVVTAILGTFAVFRVVNKE